MEPEFQFEAVQRNANLYWFHVDVITAEGKKSTVLAGATDNYIDDLTAPEGATKEDRFKLWQEQVKNEILKEGASFFDQSEYRWPYANNNPGLQNVLSLFQIIA